MLLVYLCTNGISLFTLRRGAHWFEWNTGDHGGLMQGGLHFDLTKFTNSLSLLVEVTQGCLYLSHAQDSSPTNSILGLAQVCPTLTYTWCQLDPEVLSGGLE